MSYCSRSRRRRFTVLDFKSWAYSRIYGHFQQHLYCAWTSGVNLDTAIRFADPDFLLECKISAIWERFPLIFAFIFSISAIFLLPVCLTYWPRKYTTRVDPPVDNSHQVWSWYDYPLPSYSVFVCWYVKWPGDLDLWPFVLEQLSYMAGHVTNPATKFEDPKTIRSRVTSYNGSHRLALKMRTLPLRMRRITWPVSRGSKTNYIFGIPDPDLPIHYTTFIGLRRRLRVVYSRASPMLKR